MFLSGAIHAENAPCRPHVNTLNCVTGQPSGLPALSRTDRARWRLLTQVLTVSPLHLCSSTHYICKKDQCLISLGSRVKLLLFSCQDLKRISKEQCHALDWKHKRTICLHEQPSCRLCASINGCFICKSSALKPSFIFNLADAVT